MADDLRGVIDEMKQLRIAIRAGGQGGAGRRVARLLQARGLGGRAGAGPAVPGATRGIGAGRLAS